MRLIPGKTKVKVELFKGVTIGDIIVVAIGAALVVLFAISSLPWKLGICIALAFLTFFLVLRLDDEANYLFVLKMLRYLVLPKRFNRVYTDEMLVDKKSGRLHEEVIDKFRQENEERKGAQTEEEEQIDYTAAIEGFADQIAAEGMDGLQAPDEEAAEETNGSASDGDAEETAGAASEETTKETADETAAEDRLPDYEDWLASEYGDELTAADSDEITSAIEGFADQIAAEGMQAAAADESQMGENDVQDSESASGSDPADTAQVTAEDEGLNEKTVRRADRRAEKKARKADKKEEKKAAKARAREIEEKLAEKPAAAESEKEKKAALKELIKEENKILKSKTATEEEKNAVWKARADRSALAKKEKEKSREENATGQFMENLSAFTDIKDDFIEYGGKYYGAVIEIDPLEFRFFSKHRRDNSIENGVGKVLRSLQEGDYANIVKIERPALYDDFMSREFERLDHLKASYESGMISEEELQTRVEIVYDRINELRGMCFEDKVITAFYYLVLFDPDKGRLNLMTHNAMASLRRGEMTVRRLDTRGLAIFLKYTNQLDFEEREIDKIAPEDYAQWAMPESVRFKFRETLVSNVITYTYRVSGYPTMVGDAFLAGVMSIPGTKVVLKCTPIDRTKAITGVDRALQELRSQYSNTNIDSKLIELSNNITSLSNLLSMLQSDNEVLMDVNIYVTIYDIAATRMDLSIDAPQKSSLPVVGEMEKMVRQLWSEEGMRLARMDFDQLSGYVGSQVSAYDPLKKLARGMPSNSVAASFPWIYSHISDDGGFKMGTADGIPVFVDFFRRDDERINSNMVVIGKSGSGKSFATKALLSNLSADDAKIFILDPENEYQELAHNMHGKVINVGNAQYGRLNPFHIITALDDDEDEGASSSVTGSFATHLQFLEEFFKQILPDCDKDALEYLNSLVERMYTNRGIYAETDLSNFGPEDYPVFDDLYDEVLAEFERTENEYLRTMLRTLINYIAKFSTGGRNANIWNGPSTVTTDENFTVFNFQSMLSNRNTTIANAQMLLVLKYIDNEIIKNRDYNIKYGLDRKIVVVIDEAHVFIDDKYPIALDFMFQLAKRIRKYNGMQIVITQNIKDFVGSEEIARKSTAIINACQYSFIFALAPNDISDLCKLYEKAGGINEHEQEQILQAPRGQAFTVLSATSRSTFQVEVPPTMVDLFQQKEYTSHYFYGEQGSVNWEDFVSESRDAHDRAVEENKKAEAVRKEDKPARKAVTFSILTEDELAAQKEAVKEAMEEQGLTEETDRLQAENETADLMTDQTGDQMDGQPDDQILMDAELTADDGFADELPDVDLSDEEFDAMIAARALERAGNEANEGVGNTESVVQAESAQAPAAAAAGATRSTGIPAHEISYDEASAGTFVRTVDRAAHETGNEIDKLRRELELERNRLETERLETQRRTLELERATLEAQKNASLSDAVVKLGEMLAVMQQSLMQQSAMMSSGFVPPAAPAGAAMNMPQMTMPQTGTAPAFGAAAEMQPATTPADSTESSFDMLQDDIGMSDTKDLFDETDTKDEEDLTDLLFGLDDEDEENESVLLPADEEDEDAAFDDIEIEDFDEDELTDAADEDLSGDAEDIDLNLDEDDNLDLPDEDEFEKFLFGDDDDDDEDDDDDDSALSFNIFDMFEQEAELAETYNPMDDFMDGEDDVLEITIEQLIEYNKNAHKRNKESKTG